MQPATRKPSETAAPRMDVLAKLPVFLDLDGKRVVVAGGSAAAAGQAEVLAATGAAVEIYAPTISEEMAALLVRGAGQGTLTHHAHRWSGEVLAAATIALADVDSECEAKAFARAAHVAGALVSVVGKPQHCQFQLGAIVNRSPVVVGVSSSGAVPGLEQAVRRRIEAVLPPTLATWAAAAKQVGARMLERLRPGSERPGFWAALADRVVTRSGDAVTCANIDALIEHAARTQGVAAGRVTLVGAGPGDTDLLTLKAWRALQTADVILYDDLVSPHVLELARREAKRMLVGKRGQRPSCDQADINGLMIKLARQGRHVVRLKSGDPMIFGRAGEEIAMLAEHGIAVEAVPGITSAMAMAATLGVSLTHRDHAQSVRFVTGHARDGELPAHLDWQGMAQARETTIFYMGGRTAGAIAARLQSAGLASSTPVAAMAGASTAQQQVWRGQLGDLESGVATLPPHLPVLIGIGEVFAVSTLGAAAATAQLAAA